MDDLEVLFGPIRRIKYCALNPSLLLRILQAYRNISKGDAPSAESSKAFRKHRVYG
jgi:hypothetical protein